MTNRSRDVFDAIPPSDTDLELSLLAALLVDPTQLDSVTLELSASDFHDPVNGRLYAALATLHDARELRPDIRLLVPQLRSLHINEAVWPTSRLAQLIGQGIASHAAMYATQLRRLSLLRRQRDVACQLLSRVHQADADPEAISSWCGTAIEQCGDDRQPQSRLIGEIAADVLATIEDTGQRQRGVMTGLLSVDSATGGMMPGELVILAARPGNGKTSLATQIALHNAMRRRNVLVISLEMTQHELTQRVICPLAGVDGRRVRAGTLTSQERQALVTAASELHGSPLRIADPSAATIQDVRALARLHHVRDPLALVVLDYIGLVRPTDHRRQRYEQVGEVTVGVKALAKELAIPVLACCQLNRSADQEYGRNGEKKKVEPTLGMLRESGSIEQDADQVWFLHHEEKSSPVSFIVAKHRHGETGKLPLEWLARETQFRDADNRVAAFDEWNR